MSTIRQFLMSGFALVAFIGVAQAVAPTMPSHATDPAPWHLMIGGSAVVGAILRRRRNAGAVDLQS